VRRGRSAAHAGAAVKKLTARETVVELLRTYQDVTCPLNSAGDWIGRGPGSRYLDRPPHHPYFTGSYRTLEAILRHMQAGGGLEGDARHELAKWAWAVAQSYILCERRMVERQVKRKAKNNRTVTVTERFTEPVRNGSVREKELDAGIDWIAAEFVRRGILPFLPIEMLEAVAA
jgi:hypothetical protein